MSKQLSFDLPVKPALEREDFFVSSANAMAVALIDAWPNWTSGKLLITGPSGCGKTHLCHCWAKQSAAQIIHAKDLTKDMVEHLAAHSVAVEGLDQIAGDKEMETALFHLHNLTLANGNTILFTGQGEAAHWPITLPDLKSRLMGTTSAQMQEPDDDLLSTVLVKLFADRQLFPAPDVITYILRRIDRSFSVAYATVDRIDKAALDEKRPITRSFVRTLFEDNSE